MSTMLENIPQAFDDNKVAQFEERFTRALNDAGVLLMTSVGHRLGLFNAMHGIPPMSSEELAARTDLNERYIREWLGALVAGRVIDMDPGTNTYWLPNEHAELLTDHGEANMAVYAQFLPLLGKIEDDILQCFREGGGVPYERYDRFHEVMAEDSAQTVIAALFDAILPLIDGIEDRLETGIRVLDVGCGRGRALLKLAQRFPNSQFTGYDLSAEAIGWAREQAQQAGLSNVNFEARDLSDFDETAPPQAFEFITTFDAIHDQAKPLNVLTGIRRALTNDGVYLAQDIRGTSHHHSDADHPLGAFLYAVSCMHCMTVSLAQGGEGLGTMWGRERALDYMSRAGFSRVEVNELEHDIQNDYFVCRP
jgi:2-polyprenyl-3-methyl-5-hydroxy-6-metoxy-1,4-benzoquinol methylase